MLDDSLPLGVYTTSPNRWRTCSSGYSSPGCGTCWELTYVNAQRFSTSINVLLIDIASPNYNIALEAMNELTGNQATTLERVSVTQAAVQVPSPACGL